MPGVGWVWCCGKKTSVIMNLPPPVAKTPARTKSGSAKLSRRHEEEETQIVKVDFYREGDMWRWTSTMKTGER